VLNTVLVARDVCKPIRVSSMSERHEARDKEPTAVIRTFICIEIPESIKSRIGRLQETLRQIDAQVSWTKPSNIHLSSKFLGGVEASRIERVSKALERAANAIGPFEVEIGGAGCFPSPRSPRVLWVGVSNVPERLQQLYSNIEDELAREGFEREKRRFSPHLTIGRIRAPRNAARVAEALIAVGFGPEAFIATEVMLMRSDLKPTGSIYTPQATINLRE
jgi:2'-5' RNA ligase